MEETPAEYFNRWVDYHRSAMETLGHSVVISERDLLVLRAVRARPGSSGTTEDIREKAERLEWPDERGVPESLGGFLVRLARHGMLKREPWPRPAGSSSNRPTVSGYTLTEKGADAVRERWPELPPARGTRAGADADAQQ
jgi:hypothetical protein